MTATYYAYAYRSGEIGFDIFVPKGALALGKCASRTRIKDIVTAIARQSYDGKTLLVPWLAGEKDDKSAFLFLHYFKGAVEMHLAGIKGWPAVTDELHQAQQKALANLGQIVAA